MDEQQSKVTVFYSLWLLFGVFVFLPLYFSGARILLAFCLLSFFIFLAMVYDLKKYKNNMSALKVGKDHYVRMIFIAPLLITPAFDNIGEYHKEQIMYKAMVKMRQVKLKKEEKESLASKIQGIDIGVKVVSLPSKLISNTVAWSISPLTRELDEDSYCSKLFIQKLEKKSEEEMLAKIKRSEISVHAREIDDSGGIDQFMKKISSEALDKMVDSSYLEAVGKELGHAVNLVLGSNTCQMLLLNN